MSLNIPDSQPQSLLELEAPLEEEESMSLIKISVSFKQDLKLSVLDEETSVSSFAYWVLKAVKPKVILAGEGL